MMSGGLEPCVSGEASGGGSGQVAYESVRTYCLGRQLVTYMDLLATFYNLTEAQLHKVLDGLQREGLIKVRGWAWLAVTQMLHWFFVARMCCWEPLFLIDKEAHGCAEHVRYVQALFVLAQPHCGRVLRANLVLAFSLLRMTKGITAY